MTQFVPTRRTALLVPTGDGGEHLFFVLTEVHGDPPSVLMANCSSVPSNKYVPYDETCVLEAKEHKFLNRPSYVAYRFADIVTVQKINQKVRAREWKLMAAISEECCARICAGVLASPAIPLKCKTFYKAATGNQK